MRPAGPYVLSPAHCYQMLPISVVLTFSFRGPIVLYPPFSTPRGDIPLCSSRSRCSNKTSSSFQKTQRSGPLSGSFPGWKVGFSSFHRRGFRKISPTFGSLGSFRIWTEALPVPNPLLRWKNPHLSTRWSVWPCSVKLHTRVNLLVNLLHFFSSLVCSQVLFSVCSPPY